MPSGQPNPGLMEIVNTNIKSNIKVCEVGVYDGSTTLAYGPTIKEYGGHIYLVDWFKGNIGAGQGPHKYNEDNKDNVKQSLIDNLTDAGCIDIVTILEGVSWEQAQLIPDDYLDICFIDGDHRYSSVQKDLQAYWPKVKNNGLLCGDDLENISLAGSFSEKDLEKDSIGRSKDGNGRGCQHPGVIQAVFEFCGPDINIHPNWTWSYVKQ